MKKFIALLLAMVMVFALCDCSNNNDDKNNRARSEIERLFQNKTDLQMLHLFRSSFF